jgi:hypothetical protein
MKLLMQENVHQIKEVLGLLVKGGADINELDNDGQGHLHRLCSTEGTMLTAVKARHLLQAGANPQQNDLNGQTPLQILEESFEGPDNVKTIIKEYLTKGVSQKSDEYVLYVKTMGGSMYPLNLPNAGKTTVLQVKEAIYQKEDVPIADNSLKFGKVLLENDNATLDELHIRNEDAILSILVAKR